MSSYYNQLVDLGNDQKLIAATEVGAAPLPDLLQLYEAHWSWFCVWNAPFINDPEWNSQETLETVSTPLPPRNLLPLDCRSGPRSEFVLTTAPSAAPSPKIYNHEYVLTLDEIQGWREEYA